VTKLDAILIELEPELQQALLDAFDGIRKGVDMRALRDAVDRGDVQAVEDALNVDEGSFWPYITVATIIYMRYGALFAPTLIRGATFNANTGFGQDVIRQNTARMTEETKAMARDMVIAGYGRREVANRIRESIGLSRAQQGYVESMRRRLESNDASELRAILKGSTLRDKRFDPAIKKAIANIEAGKPSGLSARKIEDMTGGYTRKLIRKRAQDVAAAEVIQYAEASKFEAVKQTGRPVTKIWRHSRIWLRARVDHVYMNGKSVEGMETPFVMPDGVLMQYPHDPAGGAKHNANCRCRAQYRVVRN